MYDARAFTWQQSTYTMACSVLMHEHITRNTAPQHPLLKLQYAAMPDSGS